MGDYARTVDQLPSPQAKFASKPIISGTNGGHTLNLHQFARHGVTLLGRIQGVKKGKVILAQDLRENLTRADMFEHDFTTKIDEFIAKNGLDAPLEVLPKLRDGLEVEQPLEVNLQEANITIVIWATGYGFDFSLVQVPIFDGDGYPIQNRGVTDHKGLYSVGLPWLHNARCGLLWGAAQDACHIATIIDRQTRPHSVGTNSKQRIVDSEMNPLQKAEIHTCGG